FRYRAVSVSKIWDINRHLPRKIPIRPFSCHDRAVLDEIAVENYATGHGRLIVSSRPSIFHLRTTQKALYKAIFQFVKCHKKQSSYTGHTATIYGFNPMSTYIIFRRFEPWK